MKEDLVLFHNFDSETTTAPYYGLPIINIGTRQQNRALHADMINVDYDKSSIQNALVLIDSYEVKSSQNGFGEENSAELFLESLKKNDIWQLNHQKQFRDYNVKK